MRSELADLQVLSLLDPLDLLNCARTDKTMRERIMTRSSGEAIWKAVYVEFDSIIGDQQRPTSLSLPAFTAMLFDRHCLGCGSATDALPLWRFRTRLCPACVTARCCTMAALRTPKSDNRVPEVVASVLSSEPVSGSKRTIDPRPITLCAAVVAAQAALGPRDGDWQQRFRTVLASFERDQSALVRCETRSQRCVRTLQSLIRQMATIFRCS